MRRRQFLHLAALPAAAQLQYAPSKPGPPRTLFLFADWFHVNKGDLRPVLDESRISEEGRKKKETFEKSGQIYFSGAHGFRGLDVPYGVRITPEIAERSKPVLSPDAPWEADFGYHSVIHEGGLYKCWYYAQVKSRKTELAIAAGRAMEITGSAMAYAESTDGFNWKKPTLKLLKYDGSMENNLITTLGNTACVFRDPHGPPEERFKAVHFDKLPAAEIPPNAPSQQQYGLYGIYSADGFHWKQKPKVLVHHFADTLNVIAWDPLLEKYVGYFRDHMQGRSISRSETTDFWNWPEPQALIYTGPRDFPSDDFYTNGYTTYPGDPTLRLLFPAIYHRDSDSVDAKVAISREGRSYNWLSDEPLIRNGTAGEWDHGGIYPSPQMVRLPDGRLALPYRGYSTTHNEFWFSVFYKQYQRPAHMGWAIWQDGRLAGIEAEHRGEFTTINAPVSGAKLQINARTSRAGSVEVELRQQGKPVDGFTFADCVPFHGDEIWTEFRWKDKSDLSALRGRGVTVAFRLNSAKVFAFRYA
jgi:hypothetical protein